MKIQRLVKIQRLGPTLPAQAMRSGAYSDAQIQTIEDKLNQRPRKRLGIRTPQQVFDVSFNRDALRS